jgi:LemA protein
MNLENIMEKLGAGGIVSIVVLLLIVFTVSWAVRLFNRLVRFKALHEEGWSGILAALKRRSDLLPNLVETASSYMGHESETLVKIAEARALTQSAKGFSEVMDAETHMMSALTGFRTFQENYPQLKADKNMMHIQEELSALEERIEKTRRYYNATVRDFNMEMDRFPANIVAGAMGFKHARFFETDEKSQEAPSLRFSNRQGSPVARENAADSKFLGAARRMSESDSNEKINV